MLVEMTEAEYEVAKKILDEGIMADLAAAGLCLAMVFGIRACSGKAADDALHDVKTMDGNAAVVFNNYNQENFGGVLSDETAHAKALFGAIVQYAQQHHMTVAQAAKEMKTQLAQGWQNNIGIANKVANRSKITSVVTTTDGEEEIVVVSFRYVVSSGNRHGGTTYAHSEIIIPANAADMQRPHKEKPQPVAERPAPPRSASEQEAMAKGTAGWRP